MERGRSRLLEPLVSCMSRELSRIGVEDGAQARLSQLQAACQAAGADAGASPQVWPLLWGDELSLHTCACV